MDVGALQEHVLRQLLLRDPLVSFLLNKLASLHKQRHSFCGLHDRLCQMRHDGVSRTDVFDRESWKLHEVFGTFSKVKSANWKECDFVVFVIVSDSKACFL